MIKTNFNGLSVEGIISCENLPFYSWQKVWGSGFTTTEQLDGRCEAWAKKTPQASKHSF